MTASSLARTVAGAIYPALGVITALELWLWARVAAGDVEAATPELLTDGAFFLIVIGTIAAGRGLAQARWGEAYLGALLATGPVVPFLVSLGVLLLYLRQGPGDHASAVYVGLAAGLGAWIFGAPLFQWMARADTAQSRSYGDLVMRTRRAAERLARIEAAGVRPIDGSVGIIRTDLQYLQGELGLSPGTNIGAGLRYASAVGYMNLWRAVHRVEERLLTMESLPELFGAALYNSLRLRGVPNGTLLTKKLHGALATFGPAAKPAICDQDVQPQDDPTAHETARAVISEVVHALNVYLDDSWERLIRQRNRLLRTILVTSTVGLLLISLAVLFHVPKSALGAAGLFYLVGALVGLFAQLRVETRAGLAVDDYGLFEARLLATPLLSGLAAVAGVVLVAFTPGLAGLGADAAKTTVHLAAALSLEDNPGGLVAAAIFGLTPQLLIGWLSKQADDEMTRLKNVNAGEKSAPRQDEESAAT